MGPVLSPDRPVCMLPTVWTVVGGFECVQDTENKDHEPGQYREDFVRQQRLSSVRLAFGERVDCMFTRVNDGLAQRGRAISSL